MKEDRYDIGDVIMERYEVRQIIPGGMGIVYICQDYKDNIPFALKTFYDKYLTNKAAKERFINEATTWINLDYHINIVQAERIEIIGGKPFIVLECVLDKHGISSDLAQKLSRGPLEIRTALNYAIQICLGMNHAQQKFPGLVHRDIKPNNILISFNDIAKVSDFGIAAVFHNHSSAQSVDSTNMNCRPNIGNRRTRAGQLFGTHDFMSPEQYCGRALDARSDIYSFGCVLYEMLTGKNFTRYSLLQSESNSELFAGLHPDVISILQQCLSYEPELRFQNFYETGKAIEKCYKMILCENLHIKVRHQTIPGVWIEFLDINSFTDAADFTASFDRSAESGKLPASLNLLRKGNSLMKLGHYKEALQCFERWISDYDPESDNFKEYISNYKGDIRAAVTDQKKSIANVYVLKANALGALGRGKEAINCYEKALSLDPEDYNTWYNFAESLFNVMHDSKGAVEAYRRALKLNPRDDMAWASLGCVVSEMGDNEEAIKCCDKALEINPNLVSALGNKGVAMLRKNMKTDALECFQRIINNEPANALAWYYKAITLPESHRSEILESLERASQLDPDNIYFQATLKQAKDFLIGL